MAEKKGKKDKDVSELPSYYIGVGHVVHLSTNQSRQCDHCERRIRDGGENFSENVNHYIIEHGYKLLHVGGETSSDSEAKPWHSTIAVLGRGTA
jgi:hypothetical protein